MTELNWETIKIVAATLGTVITAIFGNSVLKRRWSKDNVAVAHDGVELSMLDRLQAEVEKMRLRDERLTAERDRAVGEVSELKQKILSMTFYIEKLEKRLDEQALQASAQQDQINYLLGRREKP